MSHKVSSCEVLVAGGGIIGAACARAAALAGLRVAICEPGPEPAAASAASAGILGAQIERTDESLRALGLRGRDLYESLAASRRRTREALTRRGCPEGRAVVAVARGMAGLWERPRAGANDRVLGMEVGERGNCRGFGGVHEDKRGLIKKLAASACSRTAPP